MADNDDDRILATVNLIIPTKEEPGFFIVFAPKHRVRLLQRRFKQSGIVRKD